MRSILSGRALCFWAVLVAAAGLLEGCRGGPSDRRAAGGPGRGPGPGGPEVSWELVYEHEIEGNVDLYLLAAGEGVPRRLTVDPGEDSLAPNWRTARKFLTSWCNRAMASGIGILQRFARTLRKHARGILNYFKFPISTGPLEGTNNKIRTMQRQAYGFRDHQFFKLKIYALHETRFELVG